MLNKVKEFLTSLGALCFFVAVIIAIEFHWIIIAMTFSLGLWALISKPAALPRELVKYSKIAVSGMVCGLFFRTALSGDPAQFLKWVAIISIIVIATHKFISVAKSKNWFKWLEALP